MRKVLLFLVILLFALSGLSWAEGMKVLTLKVNEEITVTLTVPEKAPDFLYWPTSELIYCLQDPVHIHVIGYSNGEIAVVAVVVFVEKQPKVVNFFVQYKREAPWEYYEDTEFFKSGKLTGVFAQSSEVKKFYDTVEHINKALLKPSKF